MIISQSFEMTVHAGADPEIFHRGWLASNDRPTNEQLKDGWLATPSTPPPPPGSAPDTCTCSLLHALAS